MFGTYNDKRTITYYPKHSLMKQPALRANVIVHITYVSSFKRQLANYKLD